MSSLPFGPESEMEYNRNGNEEMTFSRLDQEEFFPKETIPWSREAKIHHVPHGKSQVLLVILSFALLCGLIALSVLYAKKSNLTDSLEAKNRNLSASIASLKQEIDGFTWKHHGGQSFHFSTERLSWMESRDYCITMGAKLVVIKSEEKQEFLVATIKDTHWIGLSDLVTEGKWYWVDDTPLSPTEKQFWYQRDDGDHEPDNWMGSSDANGEDCAALGNEAGMLNDWFDSSCSEQKRFICEK